MNFLSRLLRQKVSDFKMAATNQLSFLCSVVDLWFKTLEFRNKNNMSQLSRFELYKISMSYISDLLFLFVYSAI